MDSRDANTKARTNRHYTYLGMLAGAGSALVIGSLYYASLVSAPSRLFEIASRYTLIGLVPVVAGSLVIGVGALRLLNKVNVDALGAAAATFGLSMAVAFVTALVGREFGLPFGLGLLTLGVPIIWCMTLSGVLLAPLSRHRNVSVTLLAGVGAVSVAGALAL